MAEFSVGSATRAHRFVAVAAVAVVAGLASAPYWASRDGIQLLGEFFAYAALASLWNLLAGYAGLVSVGQQAFVGLGGYVMAALQAGSLTDFVLVPSYFNCCYGLPPGVQHVVIVRLMPKDAIKYTTDEVWVQGILHVNVVRDDGYTTQIFSLDGESVTPVAP